jgi:hypothetical protein
MKKMYYVNAMDTRTGQHVILALSAERLETIRRCMKERRRWYARLIKAITAGLARLAAFFWEEEVSKKPILPDWNFVTPRDEGWLNRFAARAVSFTLHNLFAKDNEAFVASLTADGLCLRLDDTVEIKIPWARLLPSEERPDFWDPDPYHEGVAKLRTAFEEWFKANERKLARYTRHRRET